jgi:hypothetical protein
MLVGHFAAAFVGKRVEPRLSLGTLLAASMLPDLLWPVFSMAGIEYVSGKPRGAEGDAFDVPFSHSLLMVAAWGVTFAAVYFLRRRYTRGALILFAAVLSHWLLDAVAHKHALAPGLHKHYGLELWQSLTATIIVEGGFWLLALVLYARASRPLKRAGTYAFWPVVAFLTFVWVTNVKKGPPPPEAVAGSLIFFALVIAWAYWMNRARATTIKS